VSALDVTIRPAVTDDLDSIAKIHAIGDVTD